MTETVHVSLLGAILAAAFAASMGSLLVWMLRVPRPVSLEVARAVRSVGAARVFLVPILEHYYSERAVELAARLGQTQKAKIVLGYVVEVPRTLSLSVPLPETEERANLALQQAKQICAMHALEAQLEIIRAREAGEGIARLARDRGVDVIVMGISPGERLTEGSAARTAEALFRHAPCEVIIDRLAETSLGATPDEPPLGTPPATATDAAPPRKEAPKGRV